MNQAEIKMEIMRFLRGQYKLDEEPGLFYSTPCLRFRQGKKTIATLLMYEDHYGFLIVLGKAEREKAEAEMHSFPPTIQKLYEETHAYHDGKWLVISIDSPETWEAVKRMILIKKKPNRKPFPADGAVRGKCGNRCDLCVHFVQTSEEARQAMLPHLNDIYGNQNWAMRCTGCATPGCQCYQPENGLCDPLRCLAEKQMDDCRKCEKYPCEKSSVGYQQLEHRALSAKSVTLAVLPYVPDQYENREEKP